MCSIGCYCRIVGSGGGEEIVKLGKLHKEVLSLLALLEVGAQFNCFTGAKLQILTLQAAGGCRR
jgi:enhancing lycopene biosynthesis protein 2